MISLKHKTFNPRIISELQLSLSTEPFPQIQFLFINYSLS